MDKRSMTGRSKVGYPISSIFVVEFVRAECARNLQQIDDISLAGKELGKDWETIPSTLFQCSDLVRLPIEITEVQVITSVQYRTLECNYVNYRYVW